MKTICIYRLWYRIQETAIGPPSHPISLFSSICGDVHLASFNQVQYFLPTGLMTHWSWTNFLLGLVTRSRSKCNKKNWKFNCITVKFDWAQHSIYLKPNFFISIINNYNSYSWEYKSLQSDRSIWNNHFASSWINSKVNGNHEITTQKGQRKHFLPCQNLNQSSMKPKEGVLPMSFADLFSNLSCKVLFHPPLRKDWLQPWPSKHEVR